ncbi:alpha/beta hydrolase [Neobacillus sp. FSL H8-0543]|uniref:alpha/beta hydrolase n=1 Tax=Neobacillus sp. FSL H8-0543 TaxID=2954672 RepID=UPI00315859DC
MEKITVDYKSGNNFTLKGDLYPATEKSSPVIVYIHGGGLFWGSREDLKNEQLSFYHQAGYTVFSIDYRLAPESKLADISEDIASALDWVENEGSKLYDYDPGKIAVIGGSAGAYLALLSGTFKKKPQAIVSFYGYGDISGAWATKPSPHYTQMKSVPKELAQSLVGDKIVSVGPIGKRYALYMYARQQGCWSKDISGLHPIWDKQQLLSFCPLKHVDESFPPTLLLHGTEDEDVPYQQSVLMAEKLASAGVPSKLITIPEGKHVFDEDWDKPVVREAFGEVIRFLGEHL